MKKIISVLVIAFFVLVSFHLAEAQQAGKVYRIGYVGGASLAAIPERVEAFRQGLRELGYVEGKNIVIEFRWANGKLARIPALAAELVSRKVDVIVTVGSRPTRAAKEATSTIPIVMAQDPDPIGNGFVTSLARPSGNVTGLSKLVPELSGKRLELLRETIPKLSRVAVFGTSTHPGNVQWSNELEVAAKMFDVKIQKIDVLTPKDIATAFRAAAKERADAVLWLVAGGIAVTRRTEIVELAAKNQLPVIYDRREFVKDGGLMSYSVSATDLHRRAATYVDKLLKGAKPAALPVEQPTKFELVINLKAAKQLGLTIPPEMLYRADNVIK
jgi:putative ABC transport system substrate-binding protein